MALLSLDLIEAILDGLQADANSLLVCSLIAKVWVVPTRKRLASSVTIRDLQQAEKFGGALRDALWLATHVSRLIIRCEKMDDVAALHDLIGTPLPRLRSLTIQPHPSPADAWFCHEIALPHFYSARRLELHYMRFKYLSQFARFAVQFCALENLALCTSFDLDVRHNPDIAPPCTLQLRYLDLPRIPGSDSSSRVCSWLAGGSASTLEVIGVPPLLLIHAHLERFAASLRTLHLIDEVVLPRDGWPVRCPALPHLTTLCLPAFSTKPSNTRLSSGLSGFVAFIRDTSPLLTHIRLEYSLDATMVGFLRTTLDWRKTLAFLANLNLPPISVVVSLTVDAVGVPATRMLGVVQREVRSHPQFGQDSPYTAPLFIHVCDGEGREADCEIIVSRFSNI